MTESDRATLAAGLASLELPCDAATCARLDAYVDVLLHWSKAFNLVGTRDRDEIVRRHLLDCAALVPHLPEGAVLDVGSGAGLPGLVIALLEPQRPVTLLDSAQRKTRFLRQAALELSLDAVEVVTGRVEDYAASRSDDAPLAAVTARAVAPLERLLQLTDALITDRVPLLAMKGPAWEAEVAALPEGRFEVATQTYRLPGAERDHVVLRVRRAR